MFQFLCDRSNNLTSRTQLTLTSQTQEGIKLTKTSWPIQGHWHWTISKPLGSTFCTFYMFCTYKFPSSSLSPIEYASLTRALKMAFGTRVPTSWVAGTWINFLFPQVLISLLCFLCGWQLKLALVKVGLIQSVGCLEKNNNKKLTNLHPRRGNTASHLPSVRSYKHQFFPGSPAFPHFLQILNLPAFAITWKVS